MLPPERLQCGALRCNHVLCRRAPPCSLSHASAGAQGALASIGQNGRARSAGRVHRKGRVVGRRACGFAHGLPGLQGSTRVQVSMYPCVVE